VSGVVRRLRSEGRTVAITPATRKPVHLLTRDDLSAYPVWEYADEEAVEGRDETWVRPVLGQVVPAGSYTLVAVDFEAADGRRLQGYVFVSTLEGAPDACQGVVWSGSAGFFVANPEAVVYESARAELLAGLGAHESELFPLTYRLRIPVEGVQGPSSGVLP
jgi:hypothetical protein